MSPKACRSKPSAGTIGNQPVFLTSQHNVFSKDQSTATLGLIWWFGRKQGAW
jgi:hypothetical protein